MNVLNRNFVFLISFVMAVFSVLGQNEDADWRLFKGSKSDDNNKQKNFTTDNSSNQKELNFYSQPGIINIKQTSDIDTLLLKISKEPFIYGYTIQVEVSQQKSIIQSAKYRMMKVDPNAPFDEVYIAPNIYLYVGRFYDRLSAYEFRNKITTFYPNSIVIGPKKIDLPPLIKEEISNIAPGNE